MSISWLPSSLEIASVLIPEKKLLKRRRKEEKEERREESLGIKATGMALLAAASFWLGLGLQLPGPRSFSC